MKGWDTDTGQSWKGLLYISGAPIFAMPDDIERTVLIVIWFLCMAWISWLTKGSGIKPHEGEEIKHTIDPSDDEVAEALRRVRGND